MIKAVGLILALSLLAPAKQTTIFVVKEKLDKNRFIIEPLIPPRFLVIQDGGTQPRVKSLLHCEAFENKRVITLDDGSKATLSTTKIDCGDGQVFEIIGVGLVAQ